MDLAPAEVEIAPLERVGLAGPEPRPREEQKERMVPRIGLSHREERGELPVVHRADLFLPLSRGDGVGPPAP